MAEGGDDFKIAFNKVSELFLVEKPHQSQIIIQSGVFFYMSGEDN